MEGGRVYGGGSDFMALLDNSNNSLWVPSTSHSFHETMVNFNPDAQQGRILSPNRNLDRHGLLSRVSDGEETGGEEFEPNPFHRPDKKRRLTPEQVQFLEKSFKVENKLEPERKVQLAKELGLQPRQVAIWFQNRRARFKTKQLEKDYDSLKASYDRLKEDFDTLVKERDDLQNEVKLLTKKLKKRDPRQANLDPSSPERSEGLLDPRPEKKPKVEHEKGPELGVESKTKLQVEDASSAKSDVYDSESPHCTEGNPFTQMEGPVDSTQMPDPDQQSDSSLDEEDAHLISMGKSILFPPTPPALFNNKFDENECYDLNGSNSCSFSLVDDQPVWSLLY